MPLAVAALSPARALIVAVSLTSLLFLAVLGATAARAGGRRAVAASREAIWGILSNPAKFAAL